MKSSERSTAEGILLTDQYQLTMAQLYYRMGLHEKSAQFDYFFRGYPNYGSHQAGYCINAGLESDRFDVEWWITSNRVKGRTEKKRKPLSLKSLLSGGALLANESAFNSDGLLVPPPNYISHPSNLILVEIPADFQGIKQQDFSLAIRWREQTRTLFENLFDSGFMVTDFVRDKDSEERSRSYYLLTYQDA